MDEVTERVEKLRKESLEVQARISMERAVLMTQAYEKYEGRVPVPVLRALAFKHIMENKHIDIYDGELIVGERGPSPAHTPTFPELCCHSSEDFEIIDKREKIFFKTDEQSKKIQREKIIPFWQERALRGRILAMMSQEWKDCYSAGMFTEFMEQRGPGHTVADDKIYRKGFLDFKNEIKKSIELLDWENDFNALNKYDELTAMDICCDAIITYARRYSALAQKKSEEEKNEKRKEELQEISRICRKVPEYKPDTVHEALQMYWFVHIGVISEMNNWDSFNPGRLDQHLFPFYSKQLMEGTIDREKAKELLECFWVKFNNQPAPPKVGVTLKESSTYTDFANINIGGLKSDGSDGVNELSYLLLEVVDEMRLLQPSSNVQISKKSPDAFLLKALDVIKKGWGQPSVFNADAVVQEMILAGKSIEDARCGGTSGCVETGAFGKEAYILT
ncbi:MAG TPA: pyruvate formate lyase family protein, partial [Petrotogaceae bacterium]|nr:pyruvate formate lyase family protein [Petrotogaceae bacterium]